MTENVSMEQQTRPWKVSRLSGLSISLEVILHLQYYLEDIIEDHRYFEDACATSSDVEIYSEEERDSLSCEAQRLARLLDKTRDFHSELGKSVACRSSVCDDLREITPKDTPTIQNVRVFGFDRPKMSTFGETLLLHLRRIQAAIAAMHIAIDTIGDRCVTDDESDVDTVAIDDDEPQIQYFGYLRDSAHCKVECVRDLRKRYFHEIESLKRAEDSNSKRI